jgi:hypothetical protein
MNISDGHGWCNWEIRRLQCDQTEHLSWLYTGTTPVMFTILQPHLHLAEVMVPDLKVCVAHLLYPFTIGGLPFLKEFTISFAIEQGLKDIGCPTMKSILYQLRPNIIVNYIY